MPYRNKEQAKEASRERMRRYRQGVTVTPENAVTPVGVGVTKGGVTPSQNVIPDVIPERLDTARHEKVAKAIGVDKVHPIIYKLIDPTWRLKMYKLVRSLEKRKNLEAVFVGYPGMGGVSMANVSLYLEATEGIV